MDKAKGCVFCDIVAGKAPAYTVCEDELSMCILDINPLAHGHCLVIPKRHVQWWYDLSDEETACLFKMASHVARSIMKEFKPDFVCMYARGRRIPHTHIFLVPTVKADVLDRFFNTLEGVQESAGELINYKRPGNLQRVARRLRTARDLIT